MDDSHRFTAGEWQRQTRRERIFAAVLFFLFGFCGISGGLSALFVFRPGELTGQMISDAVILVAVIATSALAIRQGILLLQGPQCRTCRTRLGENQFRCPRCTALVN